MPSRLLLKKALSALRGGDADTALRALTALLEAEPGAADAWLLRGTLKAKSDPTEAVEDLCRGVELGTSDTELLARAAALLLRLREWPAAEKALSSVIAKTSGRARSAALRSLASVQMVLGRHHAGMASYREAIAEGASWAAAELVDHLIGDGDPELALDVIAEVGPTPSLAHHEARAAAAAEREEQARAAALVWAGSGEEPERTLQAAELLLVVGDFASAERLAADLPQSSARAKLLLAELASWRGQTQRARALAAGSGDAQRLLATVDVLEGKLDRAEAELNRVLERSPDDADALIWRGEVHRRRGRLDAAWDDLHRGIEKTHGYPVGAYVAFVQTNAQRSARGNLDEDLYRELFVLLAPVFRALGLSSSQPKSSREIADRLQRVLAAMHGNLGPHPTFVANDALESLRAPVHARFLARSLQERLRTRSADWVLEQLRGLADERPQESTIPCHVGEIELWLGNYDDAERAFLRALEVSRETRWAYVGLCAVELGRDRPRQAIEWCARGEKLVMPGRTQYAYRGEAHRRLGNSEAAYEDLTIALELTPSRISSWINAALLDGGRAALREAFTRLVAEAPGLAHDACQELGTERFRTVNDPDQTRSVLEHVLVMMRGNRSSAFVTYFTAQGEMRFVPRR